MYNVLITGSNGQLGSEIRSIAERFKYKFFFTTREDLDITSFENLRTFVATNQINAIINCAAYTFVDTAETQSELAFAINSDGARNLATITKEFGLKFIHISTDYVFDGKHYRPYSTKDDTNPTCVYGKSKLDGEKEILKLNLSNSIIIRTSWVYSEYGKNFVKTILKLASKSEKINVVFDQIGSPTYAYDLAKTILQILPNINNDTTQIYHYSNEGAISWYDFANEIVRLSKISCDINPILSHEYPTLVTRPHFSVLDKFDIKKDFGVKIPHWQKSLKKCIEKLGAKNE